ncbi:putative membrane protein [Acinetobacter baumannii 496487]|nr:putative membrane protein [Acinetobacter baumannii 951631]KCX55846.1 putative membrane protein [Acinetobacter baumannii 496487]KCX81066.1 putative membrane protein [Acinetobacter baumannii 754286]
MLLAVFIFFCTQAAFLKKLYLLFLSPLKTTRLAFTYKPS